MTVKTFTLPDLGEGLTEAELVSWLVQVGDTVAVDQPIAEVETAKSAVEVPCPFAGTVHQLHGAGLVGEMTVKAQGASSRNSVLQQAQKKAQEGQQAPTMQY